MNQSRNWDGFRVNPSPTPFLGWSPDPLVPGCPLLSRLTDWLNVAAHTKLRVIRLGLSTLAGSPGISGACVQTSTNYGTFGLQRRFSPTFVPRSLCITV